MANQQSCPRPEPMRLKSTYVPTLGSWQDCSKVQYTRTGTMLRLGAILSSVEALSCTNPDYTTCSPFCTPSKPKMYWVDMTDPKHQTPTWLAQMADKIANAMGVAAKMDPKKSFKAMISVGEGMKNVEGTFAVMLDIDYKEGDESKGPMLASTRNGMCFYNFPTEEEARAFAGRLSIALHRVQTYETGALQIRSVRASDGTPIDEEPAGGSA
jgi:hypothetical protein